MVLMQIQERKYTEDMAVWDSSLAFPLFLLPILAIIAEACITKKIS
jgi:hypothetical protein